MAADNRERLLPPGLLSGLLFFAVVLAGSGYIVFSKAHDFAPVFVTGVPVLIMIGYALLLGFARLFRLRDDQSGDNLYYMGFLFTLTSLGASLYQFSPEGGPSRSSGILVSPSPRRLPASRSASSLTRCAAIPSRLKRRRAWSLPRHLVR